MTVNVATIAISNLMITTANNLTTKTILTTLPTVNNLKATVISKTIVKTVNKTSCDTIGSNLSKGDLGRMTGSALINNVTKTIANNIVNNLDCKTKGLLGMMEDTKDARGSKVSGSFGGLITRMARAGLPRNA